MTTILSALSDNTPTGALVIQPSDNPPSLEGVSPLQNNQVIGNDGAGRIAPVTLVAGSGITITQTDDQIELASTGGSGSSGAISWTALPFNIGGSSFAIPFPLTQTVASLTSTLAYNGTDLGFEVSGSNTFASLSTSTTTFQSNVAFATDAHLNNAPLTIVWAFYIANNVSVIATGALPFYTTTYLLPSTSATVGTYNQYIMLAEMEYPVAAGNTDPIIAVPYLYVPSGSTLSGTNITSGTSFFTTSYCQESNSYSAFTPVSGLEYLMVGQVSLTAVNSSSLFAYGNINSASTIIAQGEIVSFGEPSQIAFRLCVPIYISTSGSTATTVTVNIGLFVGGDLKQSIQTIYSVAGKSSIVDTINYTIRPNIFQPFTFAEIGVSYITNNASTLQCSLFNPVTCLYDVYLTQFAADIGSVAITDTQKQFRNIPATVSLPTTVASVFFTPGSGTFYENLAISQVIDTFDLVTNFAQSQVELVFTLCFETDAHSTAIASSYPCVYLQLAITNSVQSAQFISSVTQPVFSSSGNTVIGTAVCRGRVNVLSQSTQISALAGLIGVGGNSSIVATSFKAIAPGDATVFGGAGSNWDITVQSITSGGGSGGGGTTGGITDVVPVTDSYLTAQVVNTVADIGTIQASSAQAGLITATTAFPANSLVQIESTGAVPCEITSVDGSIVVTTASGSIDLASAINASTGLTDAYSPINFTNVVLPSDIVLNVEYISNDTAGNRDPDLSSMQIIATGSVTCQYSGTDDGAYVQCNACIGYFTSATSELGAQFCLYVSSFGTIPMAQTTFLHQGVCSTDTYDNYSNTTLSFQTPSIEGQEITYYIGAKYLPGTTVTVDASAFSMYVEEILPNTKSVVQSVTIGINNTAKLVQQNYTGSSQKYNTTRALTSAPFTKQFSNSTLQVIGYVENITNGINGLYQGYALFYINTNNNPLYTAYVGTCRGSGTFTEIDTNGIGTATNISCTITSSQLAAGSYTAALGGTKSSPSLSYYVLGGTLLINEILPQANGGIISYEEAGLVNFAGSAIPAVTTTAPQYSQVLPVQELVITTRATGSLCYIELPVTQFAQSLSAENQLQLCIYTSNAPTSTPIKSWRNTCPYSGATNISNANSILYRYYFESPSAGTDYTIYVGAASLTSTVTTAWFSCNATFYEVFPGNILESGIGAVTTQANSYLIATTTGSDVVLDNIQASTTQAGLVALASATPANSLIQMGATVPVACTLTSSDSSVTITPSAGSIDLSASSAAGLGIAWTTTSTGLAMLPNRGYYLTNTAGVITMTLGTGFVLGSVIEIECSTTCSGVIVQMGAGQTIYSNALVSTDGGSMTLLATGSSMSILCVVADTTFSANATETVTVS